MAFGILEPIVIIVFLIGICYIWREEKKKEGAGVQDLLYLGAIFVILAILFDFGGLLYIGLILLLFGLLGKLMGKKN
jgi:dolichol kinase